jgi:type IV pilus assembly protein PilE
LIELLIAVAVVAILAAIALPSYRKHVLHANRSAAESVMLDMASAEERYLTDNRAYTTDEATLGWDSSGAVATNYRVAVTLIAGPPPGYSITLTPQGSQADDTECGTLTLGSDGSRSASGSSTKCWK